MLCRQDRSMRHTQRIAQRIAHLGFDVQFVCAAAQQHSDGNAD
jgi:hypothetical protein